VESAINIPSWKLRFRLDGWFSRQALTVEDARGFARCKLMEISFLHQGFESTALRSPMLSAPPHRHGHRSEALDGQAVFLALTCLLDIKRGDLNLSKQYLTVHSHLVGILGRWGSKGQEDC